MRPYILLLLAVLLSGIGFASASNTIVKCTAIGSAGTYVLGNDITNIYDNTTCIYINSSNVLLDCNNLFINDSDPAKSNTAIKIAFGYDNLTVKNCNLYNFDYGITTEGKNRNLSILNNTISLPGAYYQPTEAIRVNSAETVAIRKNRIGQAEAAYGYGIYLAEVQIALVSNNIVNGSENYGFLLKPGQTVVFFNNTAYGSPDSKDEFGFYADSGYNVSFLNNSAFNNSQGGFYVNCENCTVTGNTARDNALNDVNEAGFEIVSATFSANTGYGTSQVSGPNYLVSDNIAEYNRGNGFYLGDELQFGRVSFSNNTANHNLIGINVQSYGNTLFHNRAVDNLFADLFVGGQNIWKNGPLGMFTAYFDPTACQNSIEDMTGSGDRPIFFANSTVTVPPGTYSGVILCNAPHSVLNGVTVDGSSTLDNNGAVIIWSPYTTITDSVSHDNAVGFWLYQSVSTMISGGSAYNNLGAGYILAGSGNSTLKDLQSYNNYGNISGLMNYFMAGDIVVGNGAQTVNIWSAIPIGFGIVQTPAGGGLNAATPGGPNTYLNVKVHGNAYGMVLANTPAPRIADSSIYGNKIFGVVDAAQTGALSNNTRMYDNGEGFMDLVRLLMQQGNSASQIPRDQLLLLLLGHLPKGGFQTEYFQATYISPLILNLFFGGMNLPAAPWTMNQDYLGPHMKMSLADQDAPFTASYLLSDTNLPTVHSIEFPQYIGGHECTTTCISPGFKCQDYNGNSCDDSYNWGPGYTMQQGPDSICDNYQCFHQGGLGCADVNNNGWGDNCDTFNVSMRFDWAAPTYGAGEVIGYTSQTPEPVPIEKTTMVSYEDQYLAVLSFSGLDNLNAGVSAPIDNFTAWWTTSDCYDGQTMGLYQLVPTGVDQSPGPPQPGSTYEINISGQWVYVEGQTLGDGRVDVTDLAPYIQFPAIFPGANDNYEGIYGLFAVPKDCGGQQQESPLDIGMDSSCEGGNVITVTADGEPVADAHVTASVGTTMVASGYTDADAKFSFNSICGTTVNVIATASGHARTEATVLLHACSCIPQGCTSNDQCAATQQCANGQCMNVPCECGQVANHQCSAYACCADSDCATATAALVCQDHTCVPKPQKPECTSDSDCGASQYCALVAGTPGGTCQEIQCGCGKIDGHKCVSYECCADSDCTNGALCVNHACEAKPGSDVTCPTTGLVGDKKTCTAKEGDQPCASCDYLVTDPTGKNLSGKTGEDGNFELPLGMEGTYTVTLLKDGQPVKVIEIKAFPKAAPVEPVKPAAAPDAGTSMLFLLLLLAVIVIAVLYWRSQGGKKAKPAEKKAEKK